MNNHSNNPAQQIWQSQPVEGMKVSADVIRLRATKFERKISRRNLRETIAGLLVIVFFGYCFATTHQIALRTTWGLFIAGMILVLINLRRQASARTVPPEMGGTSCVEFFRSELEHQRDALRNVWKWYLAPVVPGYVALNVAFALGFGYAGLDRLVVLDLFFVAVFVGIWWLNQHAARRLQRTIDELEG